MEFILNNLVNAIGWSILHSLWQASIIFSLLLFTLSIKKKWSAKAKHNLSLGALILMFLSYCATFASLVNFDTKQQAISAVSGTELIQALFNNSWGVKTERYFPILFAIYAAGLSFQICVLLLGYIKLKGLKKQSHLSFPEEWIEKTNEILQSLNIRKKINFFLSDKINVPLVVGYFKPAILFPVALLTQLDSKQIEAIIIHELSHIRRNDYLLNIIKVAIETVLFFNPFVWITSKFIQIEREHACDDLVVKLTNSPVTYAHALLKLELIKEKNQPSLSLAATGKNQYLYERIKRITDMKTTYKNLNQKLFAFCLTLAIVLSIAWINPAKTKVVITKKTTSFKRQIIDNNLFKLKADTDTVTKKKIYKSVTIIDKNGTKKTYNSVDGTSDTIRIKLDGVENMINGKDFKDKLKIFEFKSEDFSTILDNKELQAKLKELENFGLDFKFKEFDLKELAGKGSEKKFDFQFKFDGDELSKTFSSPEWKEKMELLQQNGKKMQEKFDSPEFKKKQKEMEELHNSKEYKELREKYDKELEQLKKKKGINPEKASLKVNLSTPQIIIKLNDKEISLVKPSINEPNKFKIISLDEV